MMTSTPRWIAAASALASAALAGSVIAVNASQPPVDQARRQFEVASVKPNKSGDNRVTINAQPGGRFTASNVTLKMLIRNAYQLQDFQIVGGPDWLNSDRFDIVAKAEASDLGDPFRAEQQGQPSRGQLMLQALLAERFKLQAHDENRELPIFALVLAHGDGKLGPKAQTSSVDCEALRGRGRGAPGPLPPGERPACGIRMAPGNMSVGGSSMSQFASTLGNFVGRIVVDRTGLAGAYDFDLTWTPEQIANRPPGAPDPIINGVPIDPNGPSIFTAVQEQLGLKLDSQKGPVSVLVIDRAEHPVEN
jgi:uncharacterized protein (TIGR03435 family)